MTSIIQFASKLVFKSKKVRQIPVKKGKNTINDLYTQIKQNHYRSVFFAFGRTVRKKGMLDSLIKALTDAGIKTTVFSDIVSDPTIENVEEGLRIFQKEHCDCIIAVGGGSVLDCAKVIALRAANPHVSVRLMSLYVFPCKRSVPLYAVPTTSGTGSEITFFSVITDTKRHKKLAILSDKYMPDQIIFDSELLRHVPKSPTVYSGLDALTHSIEAYISTFSSTFYEDVHSAPAVCRDIFRYLPITAEYPDHEEARLKMAEAAYHAGINFRRASVGYVHAIAHRLGERYQIPHGLACAAALPYVLESSLPQAKERLDELALESGIAKNAEGLIEKIRILERELGIPETFKEIKEKDMPQMIRRILTEASLQGCPAMLKEKEVKKILMQLKGMQGDM